MRFYALTVFNNILCYCVCRAKTWPLGRLNKNDPLDRVPRDPRDVWRYIQSRQGVNGVMVFASGAVEIVRTIVIIIILVIIIKYYFDAWLARSRPPDHVRSTQNLRKMQVAHVSREISTLVRHRLIGQSQRFPDKSGRLRATCLDLRSNETTSTGYKSQCGIMIDDNEHVTRYLMLYVNNNNVFIWR